MTYFIFYANLLFVISKRLQNTIYELKIYHKLWVHFYKLFKFNIELLGQVGNIKLNCTLFFELNVIINLLSNQKCEDV